jgi:uncharacterized protein (TIGR02391 family)
VRISCIGHDSFIAGFRFYGTMSFNHWKYFMADLKRFLPPPDELLELETEEVASFLLAHLCVLSEGESNSLNRMNSLPQFNRYNYTTRDSVSRYSNEVEQVSKKIMEAWCWLEREIMLAPVPNEPHGVWTYVTEKGFKYRNQPDLEIYRKGVLLPKDSLDTKLLEKVYPLFIRGDYDTSVFQAFKEIEVRVRDKAGLPADLIGVKLMREAFRPNGGKLTNLDSLEAEQQALCELFAGSIGSFKNPSSHREVDLNNPNEAAEIILFANYLLRLVDKCKVNQ